MSKPIAAGQAEKYFRKDDYYLQEGGIWQGRGCQALGLVGSIEEKNYHIVLNGRNPVNNEPLISGKPEKRTGIDLTFSVPKSVSIMALIDEGIKTAHDKAVSNILDYIERNNIQTREQISGNRKVINTGSLVAGKFDHITSRELDPQLHTHCVIMNLTQKSDGTWRALHNDILYKDKMSLGRFYRNELALCLKEIGYELETTDHKQSFFELKGVDQELIKRFSKRRLQIEAVVEHYKQTDKYPGLSGSELFERATLNCRKNKNHLIDKDTLKKDWHEIINEKRRRLFAIKSRAQRSALKFDAEQPKPVEKYLIEACHTLLKDEVVFEKNEVLSEAA
ncbi:MAG: MobF family relaxase, partial [Pseudomonadota bacterium]